MDRKAFEKRVIELADKAVSKVDMSRVSEKISGSIGTAIEGAALISIGFKKDSYNGGRWQLASDNRDSFFKSQLGLEIERLAKEKAAEMMRDVDFSSISLTEADKKSLISVYTKRRKELLDQHVRELAFEDVFKITESVLKDVKETLKSSNRPKKSDKLIDLVFSNNIPVEEDGEVVGIGCGDDDEFDDEFGL